MLIMFLHKFSKQRIEEMEKRLVDNKETIQRYENERTELINKVC